MFRFIQILGIFFAFTFLFSAYTKWISPGYFEITLMDQNLADTRIFAAYLTRFIIGLELALGFSLLLPFYRRILLSIAMLMIVIFTLHLLYMVGLGDTENCGCFGELIALSPLESIAKNLILLLMAVILYKKSRFQKRAPKTVMILSFFFLVIPWVQLPIQDYDSFVFNDYSHFEKVGRVDLTAGDKLVGIFNLDCEHCQEAASKLATWEREKKKKIPLYALYFKEGSKTVAEFEAQTQSTFPYAFIDDKTFFELIGSSPPRIYYLKKGEVQAYWDKEFIKNIQNSGIELK